MAKTNRRATKLEINQTRLLLTILFPQAIMPAGAEKKPLAIGIFPQIRANVKSQCPGVSLRILNATMSDYTSGIRYLRNCIEGASRIDLSGIPEGVVTAEQAAYAAEQLAKRQAWIEKKFKKSPSKKKA